MGKARSVLILVLVGLLLTQSTGGTSAQTTYVLGSGDTIEVVVWGESKLSTTVTIRPDGTVTLPLIGERQAAGLTPARFAGRVEEALKRYLKSARVDVFVRGFRVQKVYILGEIARPGEVILQPGQGIASILAAAGGPTSSADLQRAMIVRGQKDILPVDLSIVMAGGTTATTLLSDDVLIVPRGERRVVILGQVLRPGTYEIRQGDRVSDLLAVAGGPGPRAALKRATLVRGAQNMSVNLETILSNGNREGNLVLNPGDLVVVPEYQHRVAILGSVHRPGAYELREGDRLLDLFALAGGGTSRARLDEIGVIRQVDGKPTVTRINLSKALRSADMTQNPSIESGDVVFVPEGGVDWSAVLSWLGGLNLLRGLFSF